MPSLFACDVSVYEVSFYVATEKSKAVYAILLAQIELHFGFQVLLLPPLAPCCNCCFTSNSVHESGGQCLIVQKCSHVGKPEGHLVMLIDLPCFQESHVLITVLWEEMRVSLYSVTGSKGEHNCLWFVNSWSMYMQDCDLPLGLIFMGIISKYTDYLK